MKKNFINIVVVLLLLMFMIFIFVNRLLVINTVLYSTKLFLNRIFPTLFIMFILQDILINYEFNYYLYNLFGFFFKNILNLSPNGSLVLILSIIGGTPSSSYMINNLYSQNKISKDEANYLLKFTYFANPLFLYNILMIMFNSNLIVFKVIAISYISNFIILFIMRKKFNNNILIKQKNISFGELISESIKKNMNIMLNILGTITVFLIISNIITSLISSNNLNLFVKSIFELTIGLDELLSTNILSKTKEIISVLIISFGGLSIHTQVYSSIYESKLSYLAFLKGRLLSCLISFTLILFI